MKEKKNHEKKKFVVKKIIIFHEHEKEILFIRGSVREKNIYFHDKNNFISRNREKKI